MSVFHFAAARFKICAAVVGGGAVLTLAVLTATSGGVSTHPATVVSKGGMTTGETATVQYSATLSTPEAVPGDKAPPFGGSGS
ncbi:hypothetical protein ACGFK1_05640 [Mycobacterium sp. NPDC048908]|uniref:hypothetical protein n=1 Tax=Mycobacterium sp. NPDC048908 TaxID=3364292 RepID=UPI0037231825